MAAVSAGWAPNLRALCRSRGPHRVCRVDCQSTALRCDHGNPALRESRLTVDSTHPVASPSRIRSTGPGALAHPLHAPGPDSIDRRPPCAGSTSIRHRARRSRAMGSRCRVAAGCQHPRGGVVDAPAGSEGGAGGRCAAPARVRRAAGAAHRQHHGEVSRPDAGGWRLFVPVKVRRNQTVLVLNRGIGTGETLTAADTPLPSVMPPRLPVRCWPIPTQRSAASLAVRCRPGPCCRATIWWCSVSSSEETMWRWSRVAARSRSVLQAVRWVTRVRTSVGREPVLAADRAGHGRRRR